MKTVCYARFSSTHQKEESITAQLRAIHEYAAKNPNPGWAQEDRTTRPWHGLLFLTGKIICGEYGKAYTGNSQVAGRNKISITFIPVPEKNKKFAPIKASGKKSWKTSLKIHP